MASIVLSLSGLRLCRPAAGAAGWGRWAMDCIRGRADPTKGLNTRSPRQKAETCRGVTTHLGAEQCTKGDRPGPAVIP